jgi:hypothetical protein
VAVISSQWLVISDRSRFQGHDFTMQDGKAASSFDSVDAKTFGLCADCVHARQITSDRASIFLQCQLSFTDPHFAKYPRLPVLSCRGYEKQPAL